MAEELNDGGRVAYLEARVGELNNTIGRLRVRIHEAVDETQRRYAKYQSRCDDFDTWSRWASEHAERMGDHFWTHTSNVHRLYVMSLQEEIARLRREVEFEANGADTFSDADRIHSEARGESEEGSGRVDTDQAGREEAAEQTVGTGYPQGSGPGRGSATPAPLSSRPQCAVHPDGDE